MEESIQILRHFREAGASRDEDLANLSSRNESLA